MDNLKSAIADKILDLSTSGGDEMRIKLEKINRFRDFSDACRSLILKYPAIETELLRMVENNDFDTKIASSRVDTIIRLSENNTSSNSNNQIHNNIQKDITELEDIKEHLPTETMSKPIPSTEEIISQVQEEDSSPKYLPEDIDYEEVITPKEESEKEYTDFEEISTANNSSTTSPNEENSIKEIENTSNKETIKKILLVCGIIAVVIALIFIIKFVINNWEVILWITGGLVIISIIGIVIKRNRKN